MSRGLTLSVLRLQKAWGCGLMVIKELILLFGERFPHLQSNSGNMHEILLSRYFREELGGRPAPTRRATGVLLVSFMG